MKGSQLPLCFLLLVSCGLSRLDDLSGIPPNIAGTAGAVAGENIGGQTDGDGGGDAGGISGAASEQGGAGGAGGTQSDVVALINAESSLCLDVIGTPTPGGNRALRQYQCDNSIWQAFRLKLGGGGYQIQTAADPTQAQCLDVESSSKLDDANIISFACHGRPNQQWQLVPSTAGSVALTNLESSKCIDVTNSTQPSGASIVQKTCTYGTTQLWQMQAIEVSASGGAAGGGAISVGTPVQADSEQIETGNVARNGNDNNKLTKWCPNDAEPNHWWLVDLETVRTLTKIEIEWERTNARYQYVIDASQDQSRWIVLVDRQLSEDSAPVHVLPIDNVRARFLKITATGLTAGNWSCFWEFSVYGT